MALTQVVGGLIANNSIGASQLATSGLSASALTTGTLPKAQLPAGTVLQVVQGTYSTGSQTSSGTYADTGLTATITPTSSSSKILIMSTLSGQYSGAQNLYAFQRYTRNGTQIVQFDNITGYSSTGASGGNTAFCYLDSPASSSALTYVQQIRISSGSGIIYWNNATGGVNATSTITLMEIAA